MPRNDTSRYFSIISYLSTDEIAKIFQSKATSIRAWAMIVHDQDDSVPHIHAVIRTNSTWSPAQICKWFPQYDDKGEKQNTMAESVRDRTAIIEYLTHENDPEKHHYDKSEIIDHGIDDILPAGESNDDTFEIVEKMMNNVPTRELVRLYGKQFVYHFGSFMALKMQIMEEEK